MGDFRHIFIPLFDLRFKRFTMTAIRKYDCQSREINPQFVQPSQHKSGSPALINIRPMNHNSEQ